MKTYITSVNECNMSKCLRILNFARTDQIHRDVNVKFAEFRMLPAKRCDATTINPPTTKSRTKENTLHFTSLDHFVIRHEGVFHQVPPAMPSENIDIDSFQ
jgi:hypothetical protein